MDASNGSISRITFRTKKKLVRSMSNESILYSSEDSTEYDKKMKSLDLSTGYDIEETGKLRDEITTLKLQLRSANDEIDDLNLEIVQLKNFISQQKKQITSLKDICKSPNNLKSQLESSRKKSRRILTDNLRFSLTENDNFTGKNGETNEPEPTPSETSQNEIKQNTTSSNTSKAITSSSTTNIRPKATKKIYLFGGSQCEGLSVKLYDERQKTNYESYAVTGFIKPGANTEEILKSINTQSLQTEEEDRIVLCVGEHDNNPTHVMAEVAAALKLLKGRRVLLLKINHNRYLNESMLNKMFKNMCSQFDNCEFIDVETSLNKYYNLVNICRAINVSIDQYDYNRKYLPHNNGRPQSVHANLVRQANPIYLNKPKKGTIPFYFPRIDKLSSPSPTKFNVTDNAEPIDSPKKGTIPYYFKKVASEISEVKKCFRPLK